MDYVKHEGKNYPVFYPGSILIGFLEDVGQESFERFGKAIDGQDNMDLAQVYRICGKIIYWGVKGGAKFSNSDAITEEQAQDLAVPLIENMGDAHNLLTRCIQLLMAAFPNANNSNGEASEEEKAELEKKS